MGDVANGFVKKMRELHPKYDRSALVIRNELKHYCKKYIEVRDKEESTMETGLGDLAEGLVEQRKERILCGYTRFHELYTTKIQNSHITEPNLENALELLEPQSINVNGHSNEVDNENAENNNDNSFEVSDKNQNKDGAGSSRLETSNSTPRRRTLDRYDSPVYESVAAISTKGRNDKTLPTGPMNKRQRKYDANGLLGQVMDTAVNGVTEKMRQSKHAFENLSAFQSRQLEFNENCRTQRQEELEFQRMELEEDVRFKREDLILRKREAENRMRQIQAQVDILEAQTANRACIKLQESVTSRI